MRTPRFHVEEDAESFHAERLHATAEMNITPMIDVLLVLLVIFMAALPLTQRGLDIELPPTETATTPPQPQVVVEYTAEKRLTINQEPVTLDALEGRLRTILEGRQNKTVFIMAAGTLRYGDVVTVIDLAKAASGGGIGLLTESMRGGRTAPPAP